MAVATETRMKAAVYTGPGQVVIEERPLPGDPGPGELLVKIVTCGLCGSDVTEWYMAPRVPVVLGHEPAGEVVAVGEGVSDFKVGDRVALHHHMPCMVCDICRHGNYGSCPQFKKTRLYPAGMAEYVRVPREIVAGDVLKLPDSLPYEAGSLIEPIACVVRALDRSNVHVGDRVIVMGAGFNGVVAAMLAPHWGADKVAVLDRTPIRLERVQKLGIDTFNVDDADLQAQISEWSNGLGPHVVIITPSKIPAIQQGFDLAGIGATVMLYGPPSPDDKWPLDVNKAFFKEIDIRSSYSAGPHDTRRTLSLLQNHVINWEALITHRFPLEQASDAWHLTKAAGDSLKVVVEI
jgi:L-iditol 2-dehydrogenase